MPGRHTFQPYPEMRLAPADWKRGVSAQPGPMHNQLLAALPPQEYARLLPELEPVPLPLGCIIHGAGSREKHLYFLTAGIVSRLYVLESGACAEFALTGRDGAIGVASFLGGESTPSQAQVLSAGYAYRLRAAVLQTELARDGPLLHLLLRYTLALITQTAQIAACNRHHTLEQQLCRWLLLCLDRVPGNQLWMTQELIAHMLGVRREGVTEAAGRLQKAGLIHYSRGHIAILDRAGLQARVCECYAVIKHEYDRLLSSEHAGRGARVHANEVGDRCSASTDQGHWASEAPVPVSGRAASTGTRGRATIGDAQAHAEAALV